jgi:hypothetical protein
MRLVIAIEMAREENARSLEFFLQAPPKASAARQPQQKFVAQLTANLSRFSSELDQPPQRVGRRRAPLRDRRHAISAPVV